ncbi:ATP-binding cassette domain-containing protein [Massilibacteroides sp.]|uniref:ATP-binding cassette domain-containing protein n=1 Tax=Massilibacteroides sp. TaxID=2034766 RepID=UPI00262CC6E8|nr:ATP-binding cassette domain-containing protein [Massilibacteroides sp.]MDD4516677.1 ATP-binding cassette domain-containing protein [Massilibacteroides sp.]
MEKQNIVAELCEVIPRLPELKFKHPINWTICKGEHWAVVGPNGAGKTLLADFLQQKHALKSGRVELPGTTVRSIAFKDIYSLTDVRNSYYQQRWHSTETEESMLVSDLLGDIRLSVEIKRLLSYFQFEEQLSKRLIFLSSGELRKLLIIRTLITMPDILILDNPFIGLDEDSRVVLVQLLKDIASLGQTQVILLLSSAKDIPDFITDIQPLKDRICLSPSTRDDFLNNRPLISELFPEIKELPLFPVFEDSLSSHEVTLRMENILIRYGERTILQDLNWEVKNNEKWSLSGANGAGKSTLLSLVCADNPQSYANTFYLFDKKRGSGESIWDIKRRIGYVSPEMHLYYNENVAALQVVASGFFDSIGLFRKCTEDQLHVATQWLNVFGVTYLKDRSFLTLSSGEQRLILLARAFVKTPDLLVLDEPLHGLDSANKKRVARIIEYFCSLPGKTLIYVTHYPEELPACVNKHFVLKKHQ